MVSYSKQRVYNRQVGIAKHIKRNHESTYAGVSTSTT